MKTNNQKLVEGQIWYPWIGKDFEKQEKKILLIGESHYAVKEENGEMVVDEECKNDFIKNPETTIFIIERLLKGETWRFFSSTYNFLTTYRETIKQENIEDFWNKVAFYNLIQEPMGAINNNITEKYEENMFVFLNMLSNMKVIPDEIIFLGSSSCNYFKDKVDSNEKFEFIEGDIINHAVGRYTGAKFKIRAKESDKTINVCFVKHPSSFFSAPEWYDFLVQDNPELDSYLKEF